jgi:hypothetical protein
MGRASWKIVLDTDCKFRGHFSTVWAVCCLYSNGQKAMERANGECMGCDEMGGRLDSMTIVSCRGEGRSGGLCDAMLSRVPHIPTLDESKKKGFMEPFGIS